VEEVLDELATLKRKYLFIVDDNIVGSGSRGEERIVALAKGMVERKLKFAWYAQTALNVTDNDEVLKALKESGCRLLFLGIEAENRDVLKSMNKKVNLRQDYRQVFRKIHEHHIGIHGSIIFGTDDDDLEMLQKRFDFAFKSGIDVIQYCTLTPYPGTKLFDRMLRDDRLFYTNFPTDWDRYDLTEILFKPQKLEVEEYRELMSRMGEKIFSRGSVAKRFFRSLRLTRSLNTAFWCFFTNKIYEVPRDTNGRPGEKFWRLTQKTWPIIHLYERFERYF
jgi:radical SAM superfamily enzyme YgiQ (UPF0313 family)